MQRNIVLHLKGIILQGKQDQYMLSSIIVHVGSTSKEGHYISYVRTLNGWYEMDDTQVIQNNIKSI